MVADEARMMADGEVMRCFFSQLKRKLFGIPSLKLT